MHLRLTGMDMDMCKCTGTCDMGMVGWTFLHPPMMLPQEEESLFTAYLHPPTMLPQEGEQVQHVYEYGQGEHY